MTDITAHFEPVAQLVTEAPPHEREGWDGVTLPRRNGGPPRFLTDVIVELGLADRDKVDQAIETARTSGTTPEQAAEALTRLALLPDDGPTGGFWHEGRPEPW